MSTPAQVLANQNNARHSTGPVTNQGKQTASRNATSHGLSGAFSVLPHEDAIAFEQLLADYGTEFEPASPHETYLVHQMVQSRWKLARLQRMEAEVLTQIIDPEAPAVAPDARLAARIVSASRDPIAAIQRYLAAADRAYYKALRELQNGRSATQSAPAPQPQQPARPMIALTAEDTIRLVKEQQRLARGAEIAAASQDQCDRACAEFDADLELIKAKLRH